MSDAGEGMTLDAVNAVVAKVNEHFNNYGYFVSVAPQDLAEGDGRDPADIIVVHAVVHAMGAAEAGTEMDVWLSMLTPRTLLSVVYNAMEAAHQRIVNHHLDKVEAECQA